MGLRTPRLLSAALILILAGCKREPTSARMDPALAPLVPAQATLAVGLRLDKLKDSPFYKTYVEGRKIEALEKFVAETGVDPRRDLWELLYTSDGKTNLLFVRGKFGGAFGQEPRFPKAGVERRNYKGYYILGADEYGVTFMNTGVAIAGRVADLRQVIDTRDTNTGPSAKLTELVKRIPATSQAWMVATDAGALLPKIPEGGNLGNLGKVSASLQTATFSADVSSGVDLKARLLYPDAASAKQIHDALRGIIGMARFTTKDNQTDLLRFYDGINVKQDEVAVELSVEATLEVAEKALAPFVARGVRPRPRD